MSSLLEFISAQGPRFVALANLAMFVFYVSQIYDRMHGSFFPKFKNQASTVTQKRSYTQLRLIIKNHFSLQELEVIVFDLGINWEELSGNTLTRKSIALISYAKRHGRINELQSELKNNRPHLTLED